MRMAMLLALLPLMACAHGQQQAGQIPSAPLGMTDLRLAIDERVAVTIESGVVSGRLRGLSEHEISIARNKETHTFKCEQVMRIDRAADGLGNGAAIGAALVALGAWNGCQNRGSNIPCVVGTISAYAGLGALIDRGIGGPETIYIAAPGSCSGAGPSCDLVAADPAAYRERLVTCVGQPVALADIREGSDAGVRRTYLSGRRADGTAPGREFFFVVNDWIQTGASVSVKGQVGKTIRITLVDGGQVRMVDAFVLSGVSVARLP